MKSVIILLIIVAAKAVFSAADTAPDLQKDLQEEQDILSFLTTVYCTSMPNRNMTVLSCRVYRRKSITQKNDLTRAMQNK